MSHSSNRPRAPEGQALLAGHALVGLAREDRFCTPTITENLLREPAADHSAEWLTNDSAAHEDATGGFDFHLGVYARF